MYRIFVLISLLFTGCGASDVNVDVIYTDIMASGTLNDKQAAILADYVTTARLNALNSGYQLYCSSFHFSIHR